LLPLSVFDHTTGRQLAAVLNQKAQQSSQCGLLTALVSVVLAVVAHPASKLASVKAGASSRTPKLEALHHHWSALPLV